MEKEIKITPPEGFEIDQENSTFECIKFKPVAKRWRDDSQVKITGYYLIDNLAIPCKGYNTEHNYNVFATKKQAKSALAMARISQIMANDKRFGGPITDEEWNDSTIGKYVLYKCGNTVTMSTNHTVYRFLAFHTEDQRDLFLEENEDLVKDYLMMD